MSSLATSDGPTAVADGDRGPWSRLHLALFRFVSCFVSLYTLDLIASIVQRQHRLLNGDYPRPFPEQFTAPVWHYVIPWVGMHILRLGHPVSIHGQVGQDSVYEYILRGTQLVLAVAAGVIWGLLDRSRRDYRDLDAWLRIFVRAALGCRDALLRPGEGAPGAIRSSFPLPSSAAARSALAHGDALGVHGRFSGLHVVVRPG